MFNNCLGPTADLIDTIGRKKMAKMIPESRHLVAIVAWGISQPGLKQIYAVGP